MTLAHYLQKREQVRVNNFYKLGSLFLLLVMPFFIQAETLCGELFYVHNAEGQRPYYALYTDTGLTPEQCLQQNNGFVIADSGEYRDIAEKAQMLDGSFAFDSELYDVGLEGLIRMFIVGIGIGAILAIINKLRR